MLAQKAKGDFQDAFFEESEKRKSKKVVALDELSCLDIGFFSTARAYAQLAPKLAPEIRKASDRFFLALFVENGMCQDLGDDVLFRGDREHEGIFQHSISPESVARLLKAGETLDFAALEEAYKRGVDKSVKAELAEYLGVEAKMSFRGAFVPFVQSWIDALRAAANHGHGMLSQFN